MIIILRVLILVLLTGCKQNSQSQSNKVPLELIESVINTEVTGFLKPPYTTLSGVIYINGTSYQFHFGKLLNGNKPDNQTIYEIASITKTYTGLLLSQAIADNQLSLNADVRKYLKCYYPDLQLDANRPVTLKHLITHSAGLPPVINCENVSSVDSQVSCYSQFTRNDFFEKLKHVKLIDRSGTSYNYSNAGVQLIGYIGKFALEIDKTQTFTVVLKNGKLFFLDGDGNEVEMKAEGEFTFFDNPGSRESFIFELNPATKKYDLILLTEGVKLKCQRIE
ncbi:serine hydrolase domain-containing protein [Gynurincola endophyticus]|uniref:serine hydrolase domain-containing protein n=1 Tax=Gynurincola endophyticus TaxID=2479004 RepID=UPI000F8EE80B|nr:serine hydrolase domain-containing protein [Gynurincola endophyticus]